MLCGTVEVVSKGMGWMRILLLGIGLVLLAVGVGCVLSANNSRRTPAQQRRLRGTAVVVDVVAAVLFAVSAFD